MFSVSVIVCNVYEKNKIVKNAFMCHANKVYYFLAFFKIFFLLGNWLTWGLQEKVAPS